MPGGHSTRTTWTSSRGRLRNPSRATRFSRTPTGKSIEEMARRTLASKHPGRMTEEQMRLLPPGLLAYWRGEAPTPYSDPTGWDEFRETLTPSDDLWRLVPIDKAPETEPQGRPDDAEADDDDA